MNGDMNSLIRRLEELTLNTWPGLEELLFDGWVIRFANGFTGRANSVNPIYSSTIPAGLKIRYCEGLMRDRNILPTFRISPIADPENLVDLLGNKGYQAIDPTWVMVKDLEVNDHSNTRSKLVIREIPLDEWLPLYYSLSNLNLDTYTTRYQIIQKIAGKLSLLVVREGNENISTCMTVQNGPFLGIFSVVVRPEFRKRGIANMFMDTIMSDASSRDVDKCFLQVEKNNQTAVRLYEKLGFQQVYSYTYWKKHHPSK